MFSENKLCLQLFSSLRKRERSFIKRVVDVKFLSVNNIKKQKQHILKIKNFLIVRIQDNIKTIPGFAAAQQTTQVFQVFAN